MRPVAKLVAVASAVFLLMPGLSAALAACAMADCPRMGGGANAHDCCPQAPATVSTDCCDHASTDRTVVSVLPDWGPSTIVLSGASFAAAVAEPPTTVRNQPHSRQPHRTLDCLTRTSILRN